jgi:CRP-like cAMP-binding protein
MLYPELYERIQSLAPVPPMEWARVERELKLQRLTKGQLFLKPGDDASRFAFVLEGLLRFYYIDEKGRAATKAFRTRLEMVAAYSELLRGEPCRAYIEALEDCELAVLDYRKVASFYPRHPAWQELGRKIAEGHYVEKERREYELLQLSASERYAAFERQFPGLAARIPQYHVASYLGITPVALSRIRSASSRSGARGRRAAPRARPHRKAKRSGS